MTFASQLRRLRLRTFFSVITSVPFILFLGGLIACSLALRQAAAELSHGVTISLALGTLIVVAATLFLGWHVVGAASHAFQAPRIVPYFSATVAGPLSQFTAGFQIASHLAELDAIATRAGVPSLSQYGFSDDHLGQPNRWHEPANAHHTVEALLRDAPDACRPDLQELAAAITRATAAKASFSLIIRLGSDRAISMYEMDLRKGKFL